MKRQSLLFAALIVSTLPDVSAPLQPVDILRAIVTAQKALRADPTLARAVGLRKFPKDAAELIANVVARDVEFYQPAISENQIVKMNRFAESVGQLTAPVKYEQVVAVNYRDLWGGSH